MKKFLKMLVFAIAALFISVNCTSCVERVDAGHEGIKVNLAGDSKGVDGVSLCTGWVFYNPFSTRVYEYPTFTQTIDYDAFEVNSKDGTKFTIDPSMMVKIEDGKSPQIFKKYRKELSEVVESSLYIYVKDAARIVFNQFTADSIISNRAMVDKAFDDRVRATFAEEGFVLGQLTPGISYPKSYEDAINAKNKAIQQEMQVSNEVKVAEANAKKRLVEAQANADAKKIEAEGIAAANRIIQQSLNNQILEQKWIDKWDGKLPVYGQVPTIFKDISK